MKIIDNFLDKEYFTEIKNTLCGEQFAWYHTPTLLVLKKKIPANYYFFHMLYDSSVPHSSHYSLFIPLIKKLNAISLTRIRMNLYIPTAKPVPSEFHQDVPNAKTKYKTGILYITKNNGYTIIEDKKIECKENRFLEFDGNTLHSAVSPTDERKILCNFNWYE